MTQEIVLKPWKAFLGFVLCGVCAVILYFGKSYDGACAFSLVAGMCLEDWATRIRDKYDPKRLI